jgi:hypothetical protein
MKPTWNKAMDPTGFSCASPDQTSWVCGSSPGRWADRDGFPLIGDTARASWNARYRGMAIAWQLLLPHAAFDFARGGVHFFANDGVAGRIAGLDLSQSGAAGAVVPVLFALPGLDQITFGVVELWVTLRQRAFVPVLWTVMLLKQMITVIVMWLYKPLPATVPAKYIQLAAACGSITRGRSLAAIR